MQQYINICKDVLANGIQKPNRTGTDTIGVIGAFAKYDLRDGFPAVTTKKLHIHPCITEMLGFLRGYNSAAQFRSLGSNTWNANANESKHWLENPHRRCEDDLGRIYGVQARSWRGPNGEIDQFANVLKDLSQGIDNRREIVTHWNPGETDQMALPPCHLLYQFGLQGDRLDLSMYQRSADIPLGVPFNIAGYAWLLYAVATLTGHTPGILNHYMHDTHIYVNQIPMMEEQVARSPKDLPELVCLQPFHTLMDLETWVKPTDFILSGYDHHPAIKYPFSA